MTIEDIKNSIRNIPDFPRKGIQFKDITTALQQPHILHEILERIATQYKDTHIDYVIGIETRGFIFGAALAYILHCGFIPVRKPGKLPSDVISEEYALEYGVDRLEMHKDALFPHANVLIVDDLLATGGTAKTAANLAIKLQANVIGFAFVIELKNLQGRSRLTSIADVYSVVTY